MRKCYFIFIIIIVFSGLSCEKRALPDPDDYYTVTYSTLGEGISFVDEIQYNNELGGLETLHKIEEVFVRKIYVKKNFHASIRFIGISDGTDSFSARLSFINDLGTDQFIMEIHVANTGPFDVLLEKIIE